MPSVISNLPPLVPYAAEIYFSKYICPGSKSLSNPEGMAPASAPKKALVAPIPDLALAFEPCLRQCDCFWDYNHAEFTSLIAHLQTLPKELRQKIYGYLTLPWSPFDLLPMSTPPDGLVALARRNTRPLYKEPFEIQSGPREANVSSYQQGPYVAASFRAYVEHVFENLRYEYVEILTDLGQKCGMLDYYKDSEYQNLVQFVKTLQKYEDDKIQSEPGEVDLSMVDDFIDWFWSTNVLDLKDTWYTCKLNSKFPFESKDYGQGLCRAGLRTSLKYLDLHPRYHHQIKNLSLTLDLNYLFDTKGASRRETTAKLSHACLYLSTHLANLSALMLFIIVREVRFWCFLTYPNPQWVSTIRSLSPRKRFEVYSGSALTVMRKERVDERGEVHVKAEKCLERLLMSEALFEEEEKTMLNHEAVKFEQAGLGCETEAGLGWMSFEDEVGELHHEVGTFLFVK